MRDGCPHMFVPASGWNKVENHIQRLQNQLCFGVSHISALSLLLRWEKLLEKYPYLSCLSMKACVYARWSQSELAFSASVMIYTARQMGDEGKNKRSSSLFLWSLYIVSLDIWSLWQDSVPVACMRRSRWRKSIQPCPRNGAWATKGSADFQFFFTSLFYLKCYTWLCPRQESREPLRDERTTLWHIDGRCVLFEYLGCLENHLLVNLSASVSNLAPGLTVAPKKKQPYM